MDIRHCWSQKTLKVVPCSSATTLKHLMIDYKWGGGQKKKKNEREKLQIAHRTRIENREITFLRTLSKIPLHIYIDQNLITKTVLLQNSSHLVLTAATSNQWECTQQNRKLHCKFHCLEKLNTSQPNQGNFRAKIRPLCQCKN